MADNVAITAGTGTAIAADDVGGVMYQKIKLDLGGDGVSVPVEATLPVSGTVTANLGAVDNAVLDTIATNTGAALTDTELRATPVPVSGTLSVDIGEVAITDTYAPVGSHSSGALISTATTLTKPEGANSILIQTLVQNVRFTLDATTPTASVGFQILAGNPPMIIAVPGASIKVIEEVASASLQYQWIG